MITWRVRPDRPDAERGEGVADNNRDAWTAALSSALHTARRTPNVQCLDITVDQAHALLYPGYDDTGRYDHAGTSRIATDLFTAITSDTGVARQPALQPAR